MRNKILTMRGRPRGGHRSYFDSRLLEYLTEISMKHGINSSEFFDKIVDAWKDQKSICENLTIECREKMKDRAIFLITSNHKAVAQFPIPESILKETDPLKGLAYAPRHVSPIWVKEDVESKVDHLRIKDLRVGMKRISIKARVHEISQPRLVFTRFNEYAMLANAVLMDETGTIKLTLWNEQIGAVSVNNIVQIENAHVAMFRGEPQLRISRNGKFSVVKDDGFPSSKEFKRT